MTSTQGLSGTEAKAWAWAVRSALLNLKYGGHPQPGELGSLCDRLALDALRAGVIIGSALVSGILLWRKLQQLDLIGVLKTRE
mgnify:CR=1 FL=1